MDTAKTLWESFTGSGAKKNKQDDKEREDRLRKDREDQLKKENTRRLWHFKLQREAEKQKSRGELKEELVDLGHHGMHNFHQNSDELIAEYDMMFP